MSTDKCSSYPLSRKLFFATNAQHYRKLHRVKRHTCGAQSQLIYTQLLTSHQRSFSLEKVENMTKTTTGNNTEIYILCEPSSNGHIYGVSLVPKAQTTNITERGGRMTVRSKLKGNLP